MAMKKIFNILVLVVVAAVSFASCIKETFPSDSYATADQIAESSSAMEASLNGIPAQMAQGYLVYGEQVHETDMAFPQFMIAFTELLGDMYPLGSNSGYDWYRNYNTFNGNFGDNSYFAYLPWFTCYQFIKGANDIIGAVDVDDPATSDFAKAAVGMARACRAFDYYLLTVMFEPVENIYTNVSEVKGLTVVRVDEKTDAEASKNNPRMTHDEVIAFMIEDLTAAEELLKGYTPSSKLMPSLAVVYGIRAKVHMWDEDYANAAKYARLAIDTFGGTPVTAAQWNDLKTGFNTANQAWMWYTHYSAENMGNLCNFIGWMSGEADWGYSSLTRPSIDKSLYDKIANNDFRKYSFLDPQKFDFYPYETSRDAAYINDAPAYLSLKFRCLNGDWESYEVGGAVDVPIMRVEEMYLIEAEATGLSKSVAEGVALLKDFMTKYRQPDYNFTTADARAFQIEVLTQERIEFWGEGWGFPNAKRIKPDIIQNYEGTNAPADIFKINCKGIKPNWNFVIPLTEVQANRALVGHNNPNPTATVTGPTPVGEFAPGN
ncbi:MAG: RagB/SusD family nutrient uptake outer membrane protein [Bacteroidales bacterium]|nr:RagB/SusD family nutrient uptake outer membrane protein [Bacteroidales bacterium]